MIEGDEGGEEDGAGDEEEEDGVGGERPIRTDSDRAAYCTIRRVVNCRCPTMTTTKTMTTPTGSSAPSASTNWWWLWPSRGRGGGWCRRAWPATASAGTATPDWCWD